jgi:hypothetical protein
MASRPRCSLPFDVNMEENVEFTKKKFRCETHIQSAHTEEQATRIGLIAPSSPLAYDEQSGTAHED